MDLVGGGAGHLLDIFAVQIHQVNVPVSRARGCEGYFLAIWTEDRLNIVGRVAGQLNDAGSVDALKVNVRLFAVTGAGEGQPLAGRVDDDIRVIALIGHRMLLEPGLDPERLDGALDV